ncbi:YncE family protein [Streptosporangium sp. NPDC000396]|uniref:YncE family protein n=1 Tax=Streptosporangium sp. NPDC000396 TaxID=3366185 RepID=UPI0036CD5F43
MSPDNGRLYVPNEGTDNVSVIDTATNTVVATVNVGDQPRGAALTADGTSLYVPNAGAGNVSVIGTSSLTVFATVPVGSFSTAVTVGAVAPQTLSVVVNTPNNTAFQSTCSLALPVTWPANCTAFTPIFP